MVNKQEPRKASLILSYNGINAEKDLSGNYESFSYVDVASGEADTISITVSNQSGQWLNRYMPEDGDYVEASIVTENWNKEGDKKKLSCGMFDLDSVKASGYPETVEISGITMPIRTNFNVTLKSRQFSKTTVKTILSDICAGAGITLSYESEDYPVKEAEQSEKTDLDFGFSLCKDHNLSMKLYNRKMVVYDQTTYEKKKPAYTIDKTEMQTYSFRCQKSKLYDSVRVQYTDPGNDTTLTYFYKIPGSDGKRTLYINQQVDSVQEAEIVAKAKLLENIRGAKSISIKVKGDTRHIAAQNIMISGLGKLDGKYFVERVTHSKNAKDIYTCTIKAHPCVTDTTFSTSTPAPKEQVVKGGTTYIVVKGDCLWMIAKKFYGSGAKYTLIYNANRGIIKNPSLIFPGQVLTIPAE